MQTKREIATKILEDLFSHRHRIPIAEAVERGREEDVSRQTLRRAGKSMGVKEVHNGPYGAFWEIPKV